MPNVVVKDNHLTYNGVSYFRGHAEEIELGSIGEKRTPLTKQNYLDVKDRIPPNKIGTAKSTLVDIDFRRSTSSAFSVAINAIIKGVPVRVGASHTRSKLQSGELRMLKLSVMNNTMERAINDSPRKRDDLARWGKDARICHQVFIVMEGAIATKYGNDSSVKLSGGAEGVKAEFSGSSSTRGSTLVTLAPGTCFAYLLLKIDWNKGKTRVDDLDTDQWSFS